MNIEIRKLKEFKADSKNIRFVLFHEYSVLMHLRQVVDESKVLRVLGTELLQKAGFHENDSCYIYVVGIMDDGDIFIFKPYQDVMRIDKTIGFNFTGVEEYLPEIQEDSDAH